METQDTIIIRKAVNNIMTRRDHAYASMVAHISEWGGISEDDARLVANAYLKLKMAKLDGIHGTYHVKHGAYLDREIILNALDNLKAGN